MKRTFFLMIAITIACLFNACTKDDAETTSNTPSNSTVENPLVGTSWSCLVWSVNTLKVYAYIDFETNTKVTATLVYRGETTSQNSGTYTLNGNSIYFSGLSGYGNTMYFNFNSAKYSPSIMTVTGSNNGDSRTWTFKSSK